MSCDYGGYLISHCKSCEYWRSNSWEHGCVSLSYPDCEHIKVTEDRPRNKYTYEGPVMVYDQYISQRWKGETIAVSKHQARTNLCYQIKKQFGYSISTKVVLCGKINEVS